MYLTKEEVDQLQKEGQLGTGVYLIFNEETGHYYIGSSESTKRRLLDHLRDLKNNKHSNQKFQNAFNKNPNFQFAAVQIENRDDAFEVEDSFLKWNAGDPKSLNLSEDVYRHRFGQKATEETKRKQSVAMKAFYAGGGQNPMQGKVHPPEIREKLSQLATRQFSSPEAREKLNKAKIEYLSNEINRERMAAATKEGLSRPEVRERKSQGLKKRWEDPVQRSQLVSAAKARSFTVEGFQRLQSNGKKAWEDPEFREKMTRKVNANGVVYESVTACAIAFGVTPGAIIARIKATDGQFKDWNYE